MAMRFLPGNPILPGCDPPPVVSAAGASSRSGLPLLDYLSFYRTKYINLVKNYSVQEDAGTGIFFLSGNKPVDRNQSMNMRRLMYDSGHI